MLHYLDIVLDALEFLLEETLLLPNRLYLKTIAEKCINLLVTRVEHVYQTLRIVVLHSLMSSLVQVSVKVCITI